MLKVKVEPVDPSLRAEVQIQPDEQEESLEPEPIAGYQVYCNEDQSQKSGESEEHLSTPSQDIEEDSQTVVKDEGPGEAKDPGETADPDQVVDADQTLDLSQNMDSGQPVIPDQTYQPVCPDHFHDPDQVTEHLGTMDPSEATEMPLAEDLSSKNVPAEHVHVPLEEDAALPVLEVAPSEEICTDQMENEHEQEGLVLEEGIVVETTTQGVEIITDEMPEVVVEEGIQEEEVNMSDMMETPYMTDQNSGETVYVFEEGVEYVVEQEAGEEYVMEGSAKEGDGEHIVAIINEGQEGEQRVLLQRQEDGNHVIVESLPYEMADYSQFNLPSSNRSSPRHVIGADGIAVQEDIEVSTEHAEDTEENVSSEHPVPIVETNVAVEPDSKSPKKAKRKRSESKSPKEKKLKKPPKKKLKSSPQEIVSEPKIQIPVPKELPRVDIPDQVANHPHKSPQIPKSPEITSSRIPKSPEFKSSVSSIQAHHPTLVSLLTPAVGTLPKAPRHAKERLTSPKRSKRKSVTHLPNQTVSAGHQAPIISSGDASLKPSTAPSASMSVPKIPVLPPVQTLVKTSMSNPVRPISPISPPAPLDVEYLLHASANFGRFPPLQQFQVPYTNMQPSPVLNIPTPRSSLTTSSTSPAILSKSRVPASNKHTLPPPLPPGPAGPFQQETIRSPTNRMVHEALKEMIESKMAVSYSPSVTVAPVVTVPPPVAQVRLSGYAGHPSRVATTSAVSSYPSQMLSPSATEQPLLQRPPAPMQMPSPVQTPHVQIPLVRGPHLPMLKVPSVPQLSQASPSPSSAGYQSLISALQKGRTNPQVVSSASKPAMASHIQIPIASPTSRTQIPIASPTLRTQIPVASQTSRTQIPTASPTLRTQIPTASPTVRTQIPLASPTSRTQIPLASPTSHIQIPIASPTSHIQIPIASPTSVSTAPMPSPRFNSPPAVSPRQQAPIVSPGRMPVQLQHEVRSPTMPTEEEHFSVDINSADTLADQYMRHWRPTGKYRCLFCHYSCVTQNFLYRHWLMNHCGLKPYMCGYCGFRSPNKDGVTRHQTAKHRGDVRQVFIDAEEEELVNQKFNDLFKDQMVSVFRQDSDNSDVVPINVDSKRFFPVASMQVEGLDSASIQQTSSQPIVANQWSEPKSHPGVPETNPMQHLNAGNSPNIPKPQSTVQARSLPMPHLTPGPEADFISAAVNRLSQATGAPKELTASLLLAIKREHEKQLAAGVPPDKIRVETDKLVLPQFNMFSVPAVKTEPKIASPMTVIPSLVSQSLVSQSVRIGTSVPQSPLQAALGIPRRPGPAETSVSSIHIQDMILPNQPVKKSSTAPSQPSSAVANHPATAFHLSTAPLPSTARNMTVSHRHVNIPPNMPNQTASHPLTTSQNGQALNIVPGRTVPGPNKVIPTLPVGGSTVQVSARPGSLQPLAVSRSQNGGEIPRLPLSGRVNVDAKDHNNHLHSNLPKEMKTGTTFLSTNRALVSSDVHGRGGDGGELLISHTTCTTAGKIPYQVWETQHPSKVPFTMPSQSVARDITRNVHNAATLKQDHVLDLNPLNRPFYSTSSSENLSALSSFVQSRESTSVSRTSATHVTPSSTVPVLSAGHQHTATATKTFDPRTAEVTDLSMSATSEAAESKQAAAILSTFASAGIVYNDPSSFSTRQSNQQATDLTKPSHRSCETSSHDSATTNVTSLTGSTPPGADTSSDSKQIS